MGFHFSSLFAAVFDSKDSDLKVKVKSKLIYILKASKLLKSLDWFDNWAISMVSFRGPQWDLWLMFLFNLSLPCKRACAKKFFFCNFHRGSQISHNFPDNKVILLPSAGTEHWSKNVFASSVKPLPFCRLKNTILTGILSLPFLIVFFFNIKIILLHVSLLLYL